MTDSPACPTWPAARSAVRWSPPTTSSSRPRRTSCCRSRRSRAPSSATGARSTTAGRPAAAGRPGHDWAIVRLGAPGHRRRRRRRHRVLHRQLPAARLPRRRRGRGSPARSTSCARPTGSRCCRCQDLAGDTANAFAGRLRPAGHPRAAEHPPRRRGRPAAGARHRACPTRGWSTPGPLDLAALENGGRVTGGQQRVLRPAGPADRPRAGPVDGRGLGDRAPPRRRATTGSRSSLACEGVITLAELDTSYFLGNAPGAASLTGIGPDGEVALLPRTRLQPDTRHRFVARPTPRGVDRVRLDVFPDGGMARLRLWGRPTPAGRRGLGRRWFDALPDVQALEVLGSIGVAPQQAGRLVGPGRCGGTCLRRSPGWSTARSADDRSTAPGGRVDGGAVGGRRSRGGPRRGRARGYRLVQEALTNVSKHAAGARIRIRSRSAGLPGGRCDRRRRCCAEPAGAGRGLAGLRERVDLLGGTLEAVRVDGGFRRCARLPGETAA